MKKKLNFLISMLLVAVFAIGAFTIPAASYENEVVTTSSAMLLINMDTDTTCYSLEPDRKRYASCMSELVTFMVATELISAPEEFKIEVNGDFIDELPYSDGVLARFVGETLTAKDLLAIMMLSSGSDAAYLLADAATQGDIDRFVTLMNKKAAQLGCTKTQFVTPGYSESDQQYTTCRDISKLYRALDKLALYREIMSSTTYTPAGFEDKEYKPADDEDAPADAPNDYVTTTENSMINPNSPYYFRYTTGGKFTYDPTAKANYAATTTYSGKTYLFVAMHGKNASEQNVFVDARRMTTWAYLNLTDRKVIDADDIVTSYHIRAAWGEYDASLYARTSAYKTLPSQFEAEKFTFDVNIPAATALPVFPGQNIGTAKIFYDGELIDNVNLVTSDGEGISLLNDLSRFGVFALTEILANDPADSAGEATPDEEALS